MASLQARHQKGCALGDTFRATGNREGCTCTPTVYMFVHMGGKLHKHKAGKNEKVATRLKSKLQVQEDEGTFEALKNIKFESGRISGRARSNASPPPFGPTRRR